MKSLRVLVLDDDETLLEVVKEMLGALGVASVYTTTSVYKALDVIARRKADLVISDVQMHPIDGFDFVRALRHDYPEPLRSTPVLMISGSGVPDTPRKAIAVGANSFLAKPFRKEELRIALARVLEDQLGGAPIESGPTETISLATESVW